jgi:hypothetical protein
VLGWLDGDLGDAAVRAALVADDQQGNPPAKFLEYGLLRLTDRSTLVIRTAGDTLALHTWYERR